MTNSSDWFSDVVKNFVTYLEIEKNRSPNTVRTYKTDLELFLEFASATGIKNLDSLELNTFRLWLADQKRKGLQIQLFLDEVAQLGFLVLGHFKKV